MPIDRGSTKLGLAKQLELQWQSDEILHRNVWHLCPYMCQILLIFDNIWQSQWNANIWTRKGQYNKRV